MYLVVHPVPGELMMTAKEVAYMIYIWRKLDCVQCYMLHYWMWYIVVGSSLKQPHPKYVDCEVGGVVCRSIAMKIPAPLMMSKVPNHRCTFL